MKDFKRHFSGSKGNFFLFGPRGTGKSSWVKSQFPDALYIDLLYPDAYRRFKAHPEHLFKVVEASEETTVIIDEVQKVPDFLSVVHALIEKKEGKQYILTGSSARKLKQEGVDLLGGRAIKKTMHPFMASEIAEDFSLEKALQTGMLPLVWDAEEPLEVVSTYVDLYVMEEVQFESFVRDISGFARFLSVIAFSHASLLNVCNIARECEVHRSTVTNYIQILEDLLLASQIHVFTKRAKRQLSAHPKFYLFDCGVYKMLKQTGPMDIPKETNGAELEGLVWQHLRAWCDYSPGRHEIYYWRTKSGLEVDFVIYGEAEFWAIEVKNSTKISPSDLRGLRHFKEDYPECKMLLLYRGKERIKERGVLCIPCEDFLKSLSPGVIEF